MEPPFKAYDVRGVYNDTLTDGLVEDIGKALAHYLADGDIIIGYDARESSEDLRDALVSGLKAFDGDVVDIRRCTSPELYWAINHYDAVGGAMITASHNPPEYNGLKICGSGAAPIDEQSGLKDIYQLTQSLPEEPPGNGSYEHRGTRDSYVDFLTGFLDKDLLDGSDLVFDTGNGVAGPTVQQVYDDLPGDYEGLFLEPDSDFPNHEPNPMLDENTAELRERVAESDADAGFAWDGDGDRFFLIDDRGEFVSPSVLFAFIADRYLSGTPGPVVQTALCGQIVDDVVSAHDLPVHTSKVGHGNVKRCIDRNDAVLGGEHSGHYYFEESYGCDDGVLASLYVYAILDDLDEPLSEELEDYRVYVQSGEQNFEVADRDAAVQRVLDAYDDHEVERVDGATVMLDDAWFNVRKSNSEPVVRLNVEGQDRDQVESIASDVANVIQHE